MTERTAVAVEIEAVEMKVNGLVSSVYDFRLVDGAFDMRDENGNFESIEYDNSEDFNSGELLPEYTAATPVP